MLQFDQLTDRQREYYIRFCEFVHEHVEAFGAASLALCGLFTIQTMEFKNEALKWEK